MEHGAGACMEHEHGAESGTYGTAAAGPYSGGRSMEHIAAALNIRLQQVIHESWKAVTVGINDRQETIRYC